MVQRALSMVGVVLPLVSMLADTGEAPFADGRSPQPRRYSISPEEHTGQ
jgi:hypothetical protein